MDVKHGIPHEMDDICEPNVFSRTEFLLENSDLTRRIKMEFEESLHSKKIRRAHRFPLWCSNEGDNMEGVWSVYGRAENVMQKN
jgi:hypothetical protein